MTATTAILPSYGLPRSKASSGSLSPEPKYVIGDDGDDYDKELSSPPPETSGSDAEGASIHSRHAPPTRPVWQRVLMGDAAERYETKRALKSRHIMMIGAPPPLCLPVARSAHCTR